MTTDDNRLIFLDTNILVYATVPSSPWHAAAQAGLRRLAKAGHTGVISTQILREYYATATRPDAHGKLPALAPVLVNIATFHAAYRVVEDTLVVSQTLLSLVQSVTIGGRQIHDANVVATMMAVGISTLYTHNTAHFERFRSYITILPLQAADDVAHS